MLLDELIERLRLIRTESINLPVVMCTQGGSGNIDVVTIVLDTHTARQEVLLQEKP